MINLLRKFLQDLQNAKPYPIETVEAQTGTPEDVAHDTPRSWDQFHGPLQQIPRNRKEVYATFGNPGVGSVDKAWKKQNIITVRNLPGVPYKWYFECHKLAEPYLREGLRRAQLADPGYKIERAASFVFRHIRHDVKRPLSYHSWGIAIDIDPQYNQGKEFAKGKAPEAWSEEWKKHWPKGLSKPFVDAMRSVGFTWGADWDGDGRSDDHTFIDAMHFELLVPG